MTSGAEKFGAALARGLKGAASVLNEDKKDPVMYRTNLKDVPKVEGLKREDGWVDMQVQFLIDKKSAGADNVVGWTVLKPGASHEQHLHRNCDEFFIVLKDSPFLNGQYTVWGRVTSGMEFVDKIKKGEPPANPDKMIKVRVAADVKE